MSREIILGQPWLELHYRGTNNITINRYPLPLISATFELLDGVKIFTKLDLRNAYHLVRRREGDEWKMAFNTPSGYYEYLVMLFGLTSAPTVFQNLVNDVLWENACFLFFFVYLDDILIFPPMRRQKLSMSALCCSGYSTVYQGREVWGFCWRLRWTLRKFLLSPIGPPPSHVRTYGDSLVLQISIGNSLEILAH